MGKAEILLSVALLLGWFLLTYGIALLTSPVVWPLSIGVLLLSTAGWRMLWAILSYGFYGLTRADKRDG